MRQELCTICGRIFMGSIDKHFMTHDEYNEYDDSADFYNDDEDLY